MTRIGTRLTGEGVVVFRDVTVYGLHRMCVELQGKYPDVEAWSELVSGARPVTLWRHRYTEKVSPEAGRCRCFLWLYWKEQ